MITTTLYDVVAGPEGERGTIIGLDSAADCADGVCDWGRPDWPTVAWCDGTCTAADPADLTLLETLS